MADSVVVLLDDDAGAVVTRLRDEVARRWGLHRARHDSPPHLTLAVLRGAVDTVALPRRLAVATARTEPFRVSSGGFGVFVGHGPERPVVVHVALTRTPRLSAFHEAIVDEVLAAGLSVEGQYMPSHWRPHVTLATVDAASPIVGEIVSWLVSEGPRHMAPLLSNVALLTDEGSSVRLPLGESSGSKDPGSGALQAGHCMERGDVMDEDTSGVVLLDVSPGEEGEFDREMLERLGHPVVVCHGPAVKQLCPLLGGVGCEKYELAHGIVFRLDLERAQHRAVVHRYRELARPDLPIRVVVTPDQAVRYSSLLDEFEVWTHEPTMADLDGFAAEVEAVDRQ